MNQLAGLPLQKFAILMASAGLLGAAPVLAADQSSAARWDAVVAAPANHSVVFENDQVRVLKVTVMPGETEKPHAHPWPSVMHVEDYQPLTEIHYIERDGKLVEVGRNPIPSGKPPEALWFKAGGIHALMNTGKGPYTALRIEIKPQPGADVVK